MGIQWGQWGYNGLNNLDTFWYSTLCELESMAYVVRWFKY
jgi:hypothetical protein